MEPLPWATTTLFSISDTLTAYGLLIFAVIAGLVGLIVTYVQSPDGRRFVDEWKLKVRDWEASCRVLPSRVFRGCWDSAKEWCPYSPVLTHCERCQRKHGAG